MTTITKTEIINAVRQMGDVLLDVAEGYNMDTIEELTKYCTETVTKIQKLLEERKD